MAVYKTFSFKIILDALTKLRKEAISLIMSAGMFCVLRDYRDVWYWSILLKSVDEMQVY